MLYPFCTAGYSGKRTEWTESAMSPKDRKTYLSMAERRAQPGSGSAPFEVRERASAFVPPQVRRLLGDIPFAIVGGLATRRYMPERMTLDVDVLVCPADLPKAEKALRKAGCRKHGPLTIGGSTWGTPDDQDLDLIALPASWTEEAVHSAIPAPDGQPYVALPYLVLMKLASSRVQDLADISRMLSAADAATLDRTRALVARHRPADAEDLESIIRLGHKERRHK